MKKIFSLFVLVCILVPFAKAQDNYFKKDDLVVNLGIGLGSALYSGSYYKSSIPPVSISIEKGIVDNVLEKGVIGIGGYLGYSAYKWEYTYAADSYGWKYSNIIIGARGNFHYPFLDKLDTYAGVLIGYNIVSTKEFGVDLGGYNYSASSGGIIWSGYVGGRYYFSDKFAAMLELGAGITYLNLGIAIML